MANGPHSGFGASWRTIIWIIVVSAILFIVVLVIVGKQGGAGRFKVTVGEVDVLIDVEQGQIGYERLIDDLLNDKISRVQILALLREEHGLYKPEDPYLFEKIRELPRDHRLGKELRAMRRAEEGPFKSTYYLAYITADKQLSTGQGIACEESEFGEGQTLLIGVRDRPEVCDIAEITITKTKHQGECVARRPKGVESYKLWLQISQEDMKTVFGCRPKEIERTGSILF